MTEANLGMDEFSLSDDTTDNITLFNNTVFKIKPNQVISISGFSGSGKSAMLIYIASNLLDNNKCLFLETEGKKSNLAFHIKTYGLLDKIDIRLVTSKLNTETDRWKQLEDKIDEGYNIILIDSITNLFKTKTRTTAKCIKVFMKYLKELANKHSVTFITTHWCYTDMNATCNIKINGEQGVRYSSDNVFLIRGARRHGTRLQSRIIHNVTTCSDSLFKFNKDFKIEFD